jgi:hypothetical protein
MCLATGLAPKMTFCPRTPKWESQNSQIWEFHDFGGPYICVQTFDWYEVKSKVVVLIKIFPTICGTPPARKEIKAIIDFFENQINNLILNPSFGHNLCFNYPNG